MCVRLAFTNSLLFKFLRKFHLPKELDKIPASNTLRRAAGSKAFRVALTTCQIRRFSYGYVRALAPQVHHQVLDSSGSENPREACMPSLHWEGHTIRRFYNRYCETPEHVKRMINNASSWQFQQLTCHLKFDCQTES